MFKKSFLKKCKKTFDKHNLILYKGLYPLCYEDNKGRRRMITPQQFFVCNILLSKKIPFILEHKIKAECFNNFYCDILVKGNNNLFDFEIDGRHHSFVKKQMIRDLKKELFLLEYHNIMTVRIKNEIVDDFYNNPKKLVKKLNFLKTKLYENLPEEIGALKKELYEKKERD